MSTRNDKIIMLAEIKDWLILNKIKTGLLFFSGTFFILVIIFSQLGMLPIAKTGDLIFWLVLIFALALYRPGWAFLFFTGVVVLENISLTMPEIGLTLRIYQALGALIIAAVAIRMILKKSGLKLFRLELPDYLILALLGGTLLSALSSAQKGASLKITLVIFSFTALYFLVRLYVQDRIDFGKIIPFFLTTSLGVALYGIWQNILFIQGLAFHGEVMPGRPNATFTEPDWLGIYLVLLLAGVYALIYYFNNPPAGEPISLATPSLAKPEKFLGYAKSGKARKIFKGFLYLFLIPIYILLIITVSRSAWLGAGFITLVFLKAILTDFSIYWKNWRWKMFLHQAVFVICSGVASLLIIYSFNLTNFQLWSRAVSTGGLQKITIACESRTVLDLPEKIENVLELEKYGCRHINLEDIDKEKTAGNIIGETYRPDPNVNIRGQVFQKSWAEIKKHPVLGIGYGSITAFLGQDERGVNLNASNIFLEVWLGSGLIGLLAFVLLWLNAIMVFIKHFWWAENQEEKAFALFILLGSFALLIPNLFNAGIFLMILWFFWGIVPIKFKTHGNRN